MPSALDSSAVTESYRIKSLIFSTDIAIIRNCNADAVLAVYPFTPQQIIADAIVSTSSMPVFRYAGSSFPKVSFFRSQAVSFPAKIFAYSIDSISMPVFCGVGGGTTTGARVVMLAKDAEALGATAVVVNAPTSSFALRLPYSVFLCLPAFPRSGFMFVTVTRHQPAKKVSCGRRCKADGIRARQIICAHPASSFPAAFVAFPCRTTRYACKKAPCLPKNRKQGSTQCVFFLETGAENQSASKIFPADNSGQPHIYDSALFPSVLSP